MFWSSNVGISNVCFASAPGIFHLRTNHKLIYTSMPDEFSECSYTGYSL